MNLNFATAKWLNKPKLFTINDELITITTEPNTDLWQRTYYGFRNDNAPALLLDNQINFSFTTKVSFSYQTRFDQCGLVIYIDCDNWFKASLEYDSEKISHLGSVVTNLGYSDWAKTDVSPKTYMWYRLSRRGADFLIESSQDGIDFNQMRIFHLHSLGETSTEMGKLNPPAPPKLPIRFGLYACSPLNSSFEARFTDFKLENCLWKAHGI